jgi:hypothetical protein
MLLILYIVWYTMKSIGISCIDCQDYILIWRKVTSSRIKLYNLNLGRVDSRPRGVEWQITKNIIFSSLICFCTSCNSKKRCPKSIHKNYLLVSIIMTINFTIIVQDTYLCQATICCRDLKKSKIPTICL